MIDARDLPPLPPMERLVELMFDAARTGRDEMIPALLQAGVDVDIGPRTFLNVDVKYIDIDTTARLTTAAGTNRVRVSIDPLVIGVGVGMRF